MQHDYVLWQLNRSFVSSTTNTDSGPNTTLGKQNGTEKAVVHNDLL